MHQCGPHEPTGQYSYIIKKKVLKDVLYSKGDLIMYRGTYGKCGA